MRVKWHKSYHCLWRRVSRHCLLIRATCDTWASPCACCMFSSQSRIMYNSKVYFWKEISSFIRQGHIKLIKSDGKVFIMYQFCSSVNPEKLNASQFPQKYCAARLTLIIIRNIY